MGKDRNLKQSRVKANTFNPSQSQWFLNRLSKLALLANFNKTLRIFMEINKLYNNNINWNHKLQACLSYVFSSIKTIMIDHPWIKEACLSAKNTYFCFLCKSIINKGIIELEWEGPDNGSVLLMNHFHSDISGWYSS